ICMKCGQPANYTQRTFESEERVAVGGAGMYEARCRTCFVPHADAPTVHEGCGLSSQFRSVRLVKVFYLAVCLFLHVATNIQVSNKPMQIGCVQAELPGSFRVVTVCLFNSLNDD